MRNSASPAIPAIVATLKREMKEGRRDDNYSKVSIYVSILSELGASTPEVADSNVADSIYEIMLPNSPYLSQGYGPNEFRNSWFMLLGTVGMPTNPKKRAFIESQILVALKGDPNPVNGQNYGSAALAARKMKLASEKMVAPLTKILAAIDEKVWLTPQEEQPNPFRLGLAPKGTETRIPQNPEIVFGYREVIQTLGSFGPKAKSALPVLRKLAKMPANASLWEVKPDAVAALNKVEGRRKE